MEKTRSYVPAILIIILYIATIPLNLSFKAYALDKKKEADIIQNIFGGMRSFIADWAFMKAEEYHHRGLPFLGAVTYHHGRSTLAEETHGAVAEERSAGEVKKDIFSRIYGSVKVTEDSHLLPSDEKEVLPWFYTETALNPRDIRGYVLGGYWLERLGRYDESMRFLKEGEKNNPDSAQILTSIGRLYYRDNKYDEALSYLERARKLWLGNKPPNVVTNEYMETDRRLTFETEKKIIELKNIGKAVK